VLPPPPDATEIFERILGEYIQCAVELSAERKALQEAGDEILARIRSTVLELEVNAEHVC
jgi:hypothetical protein